jgi:uncharacterized protein YlxW (UPF0749 family)
MNSVYLEILKNQYVRYCLAFVVGVGVTIVVYPSRSVSSSEKTKIEEQLKSTYESKLQQSQQELKDQKETYQKQIDSVTQQYTQQNLELSNKLNVLTSENSSLKQKTKMVTIEKTYPDGTIEKKTISTSELESQDQRVAQVQKEAEQKLTDTITKLKEEHSKELLQKTSELQVKIDSLSTSLKESERSLKEEQDKSKTVSSNPRPFALGLGLNTDKQYIVEAQYAFWGPVYLGGVYDKGGISNDRAGLTLGIRF